MSTTPQPVPQDADELRQIELELKRLELEKLRRPFYMRPGDIIPWASTAMVAVAALASGMISGMNNAAKELSLERSKLDWESQLRVKEEQLRGKEQELSALRDRYESMERTYSELKKRTAQLSVSYQVLRDRTLDTLQPLESKLNDYWTFSLTRYKLSRGEPITKEEIKELCSFLLKKTAEARQDYRFPLRLSDGSIENGTALMRNVIQLAVRLTASIGEDSIFVLREYWTKAFGQPVPWNAVFVVSPISPSDKNLQQFMALVTKAVHAVSGSSPMLTDELAVQQVMRTTE